MYNFSCLWITRVTLLFTGHHKQLYLVKKAKVYITLKQGKFCVSPGVPKSLEATLSKTRRNQLSRISATTTKNNRISNSSR